MYRIGIDIGGTGIKVGLVDEKDQIISQNSIPTRTDIPFSEQVERMAESVKKLLYPNLPSGIALESVSSIGIGIPGIADDKSGEVIKCTNMGWYHVPLREEFRKHIDKPVLIENDANVAALAESKAGISAGTSSSVFITLGTGIGSGIILNGKIWKGFHGIGAELGHMIMELDGVSCTCGNRGCLERYCSATALIRMARERIEQHPESLIFQYAAQDPAKINAKTVFDAAKEGDPVAEKLFRRYISYLSQAIANVINFLDPEIIVLGGGVSKAGAFLLDAVRAEYPHYVIFNDMPMPSVELAVLGAEAGILGAAMLE